MRLPNHFRVFLVIAIGAIVLLLFRTWSIARDDANLSSDVIVSVEDANHAAVDGADVVATLQTTTYGSNVDYICNSAILRKTGLNGTITFPAAIKERAIWTTLIAAKARAFRAAGYPKGTGGLLARDECD